MVYHPTDDYTRRDDPDTPWTLALDSDGDLLWSENNRFNITTGDRSIVQSLKVAIATVMGEDPIDPEFGLNVGEAVGTSIPALKRELRRTLEYDDAEHRRVHSVPQIDVYTRSGSRENAVVRIVVILREEDAPLEFVFNLFSGSVTVRGARRAVL